MTNPREIAYFVAPTKPNTETGYTASDYAMSKPAFDVARHQIWYTDGGTGFYVLRVTNRVWPQGPATPRSRCPRATGRLTGLRLGPVKLGMTRSRARRAFSHSATHGRLNMDFFCLTPIGIRVAYPSRALLKRLPSAARKRIRGRVILALTANRHYALRGVRPGTRLAKVARRLHVGHAFHVGFNFWYLTSAGASRGILKVRHGVIEEIGIADKSVTANRRARRRLLKSLS